MALKKTFSVIGLGYGDEGKGSVVDYLASKYPENSIVIRHAGGHQVGHTVMVGDIIHEFRNFGSGTFRNVPTYYEAACTISPIGFHIEFDTLYKKIPTITPKVIINPLCPIVTVYDIAFNRAKDSLHQHGSVGLGFAATKQRHEKVSISAFTVKHPTILKAKLVQVKDYYDKLITNSALRNIYENQLELLINEGFSDKKFLESCAFLAENVSLINIYDTDEILKYEYIIHEGNQGVLLDKNHGFFPHVTYGKTTNEAIGSVDEVYYVTRAYITKHGAGPLHNEGELITPLINNQWEQNVTNRYQGQFRTGMLDYDYLRYAIEADELDTLSTMGFGHEKSHLVITCMDQIENPKITMSIENGNKKVVCDLIPEIFEGLVDEVLINTSPDSATMKVVKEFLYDNN